MTAARKARTLLVGMSVHRLHLSRAQKRRHVCPVFVAACMLGCSSPDYVEEDGQAANHAPGHDAGADDAGQQDGGPEPCIDDDACRARGADFASWICEDQRCRPPLCSDDAICQEHLSAPTASCRQGRCVDAWSCLRDEAAAPGSTSATFAATVRDFDTLPLAGVQVLACALTDATCANPVLGPLVSDANGLAKLSFSGLDPERGFAGFVRMIAQGKLPLEVHFAPALKRNYTSDTNNPLTMLPVGTVEALALQMGEEVDERRSTLLLMRILGCTGRPAAQLRVDVLGDGAPRFFGLDGNFSMFEAEATNDAGWAGLLNVLPGTRTLRVVHVPTDSVLYEQPVHFSAGTVLRLDLDASYL